MNGSYSLALGELRVVGELEPADGSDLFGPRLHGQFLAVAVHEPVTGVY